MRISKKISKINLLSIQLFFGLYFISISIAYLLTSVNAARYRIYNEFIRSNILCYFIVLSIMIYVFFNFIKEKKLSTFYTSVALFASLVIGVASLFIVIYTPFILSPYHDSSIYGLHKESSFLYGLHLISIKVIPLACGIFLMVYGIRNIFKH